MHLELRRLLFVYWLLRRRGAAGLGLWRFRWCTKNCESWVLDHGLVDGMYPKLTRIPILCKCFHAEFSVKIIFSLRLQVFKLLLAGISFAVEFFQGI